MVLGMVSRLAAVMGLHVAQDVHWIRVFDNLHWPAGTSMAAAFAWLGLRAARSQSVASLRWIAIGLAVYAAGQLVWDIQTLIGYADFPSPSDLLYPWLGPCMAIGLLVGFFRLADCVRRKTLLLDAAILATAALTLVLYLPTGGEMSLLSLAVPTAYPVSLFTAACLGLIAAPAQRLKFSPGSTACFP